MKDISKDEEDIRLIDGIRLGKPRLFHRIMEKYQIKIYNFGLKICPTPQDAEDLVQESFLNVFKYLKDFRQEMSFKNWLYLIASSVCHKMKRKSKLASDRELSLDEFIPSIPGHTTESIPEWVDEPVEKLLSRELTEKIQKAVTELPVNYRLVLVLRDMEGFSTQETAGILGISTATVKVRLHRARLFLREALKEYYGQPS